MPSRDEIEIDVDEILDSARVNEFADVRVEFVPERPSGSAVIEPMDRAVRVANGEVPDLWGEDPAVTVAGGCVRLKHLASPESLTAWLTAFARDLRASGVTGVLHATPTVRLPRWLSELAEPQMTAYVAFDGVFGDQAGRASGGSASSLGAAAATRWCDGAVRWAAESGGDAYLTSAGFHQLDPTSAVASHLCSAVLANFGRLAAVTYARERTPGAARVCLNANGHAIYQVYDPESSLEAHAHRVREALLADSEHTRLAFVAMTPLWAYSWDSRGQAMPPLPTVAAHALNENTTMWSRFVPDAHAMQLLTGEHVRNASDLSGWNVTPVGHDRFLVEAPDLVEWFSPGGPRESVVTKARADFGGAIVPAGAFT